MYYPDNKSMMKSKHEQILVLTETTVTSVTLFGFSLPHFWSSSFSPFLFPGPERVRVNLRGAEQVDRLAFDLNPLR
ncbi:hypothetical protein BDN67DRAFT_969266 [Paxillus ammoniavirescens]|nr:hypothetical protein BDN67DRAFT_969266 [Paxillus ammoniavirescens]